MQGTGSPDTSARFVVCVDNSSYEASLERRKIYAVIADPDAAHDGDIRIVDESGEDYLYPMDRFVASRNQLDTSGAALSGCVPRFRAEQPGRSPARRAEALPHL